MVRHYQKKTEKSNMSKVRPFLTSYFVFYFVKKKKGKETLLLGNNFLTSVYVTG